MSRFYLGQRVRVARNSNGLHGGQGNPIVVRDPIGRVGTIAGTESQPNAGFDPHGAWDVSLRLDSGELGMAPSCCLEPATDSYDVTTWDACVWKPEHLRVEA